MGSAAARQLLPGATADEAARLWFDLARWPAFVDGFASVARREDDWPLAGGRLVWDSGRAGRGRVVERVREFDPAAGQVVEVEDPALVGVQRVRFQPREGGCEIALELDYRLKRAGLAGALTDVLFVRRAVGDALRRTLQRFAIELAADRDLATDLPRPMPHPQDHKES